MSAQRRTGLRKKPAPLLRIVGRFDRYGITDSRISVGKLPFAGDLLIATRRLPLDDFLLGRALAQRGVRVWGCDVAGRRADRQN